VGSDGAFSNCDKVSMEKSEVNEVKEVPPRNSLSFKYELDFLIPVTKELLW